MNNNYNNGNNGQNNNNNSQPYIPQQQFEKPQPQQQPYQQPQQQQYQQPQQQPYQQQPYQQQQFNQFPQGPKDPGKSLAIAGMVCGICGLVFSSIYIGLASSIVGIILSRLSMKKTAEAGFPPSSMAKAGLICGIISVSLGIVVAIICTSCYCTALSPLTYYSYY